MICISLYVILVYSSFVVRWFGLSTLYDNPFIRLFEFAIGMIIGYIYLSQGQINGNGKKCPYLFGVAVILFFAGTAIVYKTFKYDNYMLFSWVVIPTSIMLIYSSAFLRLSEVKVSKIISNISNLMYTFFLAQFFSNNICKLAIKYFHINSNLLKIIIGWSSCILIALFLHYIFELPVKGALTKRLLCRYNSRLSYFGYMEDGQKS